MPTAMILSAGYGTRLRPLTDELPKPLVPVGDRAAIGHIADRLRTAGFGCIVANAHHRAEKLTAFLNRYGSVFKVVYEPEILGTAGGVAGGRRFFADGPVIVWNGDILARPPIQELLASVEHADVAMAFAPSLSGQGTVGVGQRGELVRIRGTVHGDEVRGGDYIGVMALAPSVIEGLPMKGCLVGDVILPRLRAGLRIQMIETALPWYDIGSLRSYHEANLGWLDEQADSNRWIGRGVRIAEGARVCRSILGAGSVVTGAGVIERVIAWPGSTVSAPLMDAVVTTAGARVDVSSQVVR